MVANLGSEAKLSIDNCIATIMRENEKIRKLRLERCKNFQQFMDIDKQTIVLKLELERKGGLRNQVYQLKKELEREEDIGDQVIKLQKEVKQKEKLKDQIFRLEVELKRKERETSELSSVLDELRSEFEESKKRITGKDPQIHSQILGASKLDAEIARLRAKAIIADIDYSAIRV